MSMTGIDILPWPLTPRQGALVDVDLLRDWSTLVGPREGLGAANTLQRHGVPDLFLFRRDESRTAIFASPWACRNATQVEFGTDGRGVYTLVAYPFAEVDGVKVYGGEVDGPKAFRVGILVSDSLPSGQPRELPNWRDKMRSLGVSEQIISLTNREFLERSGRSQSAERAGQPLLAHAEIEMRIWRKYGSE